MLFAEFLRERGDRRMAHRSLYREFARTCLHVARAVGSPESRAALLKMARVGMPWPRRRSAGRSSNNNSKSVRNRTNRAVVLPLDCKHPLEAARSGAILMRKSTVA
jgi:hypothetical protein